MMPLREKDIKMVSIDNEKTLFFHVETLQIYPFENDNEVLHFLDSRGRALDDVYIERL